MYEYKITVDSDECRTGQPFVIKSFRAQDKRVLQVIGMALDAGVMPETLRREVPTAQAYVDVDGDCQTDEWVDDSMNNLI